MPRLTIIIPTFGDWPALEATLVSVLRNRPDESELIVVLARGYDDPYALGGEVQFLTASPRSSLVDLVNAGFAAARGEILHVLAGGLEVSESWFEPALRHFSEPQVAIVAPLMIDASRTRVVSAGCAWSHGGRWSASGNRAAPERTTTSGAWVGPEISAGFYRRASLCDLGTFDATLPAELAAIDLGLRMRQAGRRCLLEAESQVVAGEGALVRAGAFKGGWHGERVFWRHLRGESRVRKLAAHAITVLFEAASAIARPTNALRAAGRLGGLCDPRQARRTPLSQNDCQARTTASGGRRLDAPHSIGAPHPIDVPLSIGAPQRAAG